VGAGLSVGGILLGIVGELTVLFPSGAIGEPTRRLIALAVGWTAPLLPLWPFVLGVLGLMANLRPELAVPRTRLWGAALAHLALIGLFHLIPLGGPGGLAQAQEGQGGGLVGFALGTGLRDALGPMAALVLLLAGLALGLLIAWDITLSRALGWVGWVLLTGARAGWGWYGRRRETMRINVATRREQPPLPNRLSGLVRRAPRTAQARAREAAVPDEPAPLPPSGPVVWRLPASSMFEAGGPTTLGEVDVRQRARTIEETLASFNIEARVVEVNQGPTVTQFGIEPAAGVAVRRILTLQNDLGLRLGAWPVRFEAPVPGKRVVGLEVPNQSVALVGIRGLLESDEAARLKSKLRLAIGRDVSGRPVVADLARMPHLLI
jgi:S-DNA-T family DNA segregation ATPase FtsK/SpoIIIE